MSFCWNDSDHRRDARRDFERGRPNRDHYDRHTFDECKEVYTKEYDRLAREEELRQERRREEQEQEERANRQAEHRRQEARMEEQRQQEAEEQERIEYLQAQE